MSQVKTVIFDMDGLMFATEDIYYKANQQIADKLGMDFSFEVYAQFIGMGDEDSQAKMYDLYEDKELVDEFFDKSTTVSEHLLLNGPVDLQPGLIELLQYLKQEKIPAVVASSTHRKLVDQLLDRLDVRKYFKDVVGGDEVKHTKPDPAIFNKAFSKTGVQAKENALILEDSKNGVLAAYGAGIPVIMIPDLLEADEEVQEKALAIMPDLTAVISYIEEKNN